MSLYYLTQFFTLNLILSTKYTLKRAILKPGRTFKKKHLATLCIASVYENLIVYYVTDI